MSKKSKYLSETLEIESQLLPDAGYGTYYCRLPLFTLLRLNNKGDSSTDALTVKISSAEEGAQPGLIVTKEIEIDDIQPDSGVEINAGSVLNPKFLAELNEITSRTVTVTVFSGKEEVLSVQNEVRCLPIDCWPGLGASVEMLSTLVRPKLADCRKILSEAALQMQKWGYPSEWSGYSGNDKNAVRSAAAAIYSAIRAQDLTALPENSLTLPQQTGDLTEVLSKKEATPLQAALLYASCIESAGLNPVIVLGEEGVAAGVWLRENCFTSTCIDDMSVIEKYVQDGVNNLAVFDVNDIFSHKNASFTTSGTHFTAALKRGDYEVALDVKRCRIGGLFPLPIKVKQNGKYELLDEKSFSYDNKPEELPVFSAKERGASKERTWQRRLLDLSLKNNLLAFKTGGDCVRILSCDLTSFIQGLDSADKFNLLPSAQEVNQPSGFGESLEVRALRELIQMQLSSGTMRSYLQADALNESCSSLIRKAKTAQEEAGANTLCLALGFLKWKKDGEYKYAPLILLPVTLQKNRRQGITLIRDEDYTVNTTLLEFLKREFDIDLRGIEDENFSAAQTLALFRAKTAEMDGWEVTEDVYISQFTFARYAMWSDVKNNISVFKKNPLIASLLAGANKLPSSVLSGKSEDESDPCGILTPLPCDSSQFEAVAECAAGTTFVLHGPPGTGKSQTITNMIANAVNEGKRVLFVAEKQAALSVVRKRLTDIGIGEFCLEFTTGKPADKSALITSLQSTLDLKNAEYTDTFAEDGRKIEEVRGALSRPYSALHKKRTIGASVYDGILYYFRNRKSSDLMNIESTFYDSLTAEKLEKCESMLTRAQVAAKECGGVYRSPFDNVNISEYSEDVKAATLCAAEVLLAELKHFRNYVGLFLELFSQKISSFTPKKADSFVRILTVLKSGALQEFFGMDEREMHAFFNASLTYDRALRLWFRRFDDIPDVEKLMPGLKEELDNWDENYRSSRKITAVIKKLNKCTQNKLGEKEEAEWVKRAYDMFTARAKIRDIAISRNFLTFTGSFNEKKREQYMQPVYELHELCSQVFMDYNADAFNSVCHRLITGGAAKPLLSGILSASKAFMSAKDSFMKATKGNESAYSDEDIFDCYTAKCTSLIDNIDMLPGWCAYKKTAKELNAMGLSFVTSAMESGAISGDKILSSFRKNVYRNFVQTNIPADEDLATFSAGMMDENAAKFAALAEAFSLDTKAEIRKNLISRLPSEGTEGPLALELMAFKRRTSGNVKRINVRELFAEIPGLLRVAAPCMMMSPSAVSQYLEARPDLFDLLIFDEASQIPTCEAVPALARAKSAVIVGDPNQLPPTTFFMALGQDEEETEAEDLDSVLDDCLALGIPQKHLRWHYRSNHESLIAFSNIMYYSGKLCTFPSPDAMDSRVKLKYVENGVYDRGFTKCNREEAEAVVAEVVRRLKDEKLRRKSIGIVTFSTPQQNYIERLLAKALSQKGLEEAAYEREEPLFVKNLENVQGDERDVIIFSVCYGPDRLGRISLNFGPLNQYGGWRRLNVAVSRARTDMLIYSSMRYSMIDLSRTNSRGVAGLKAFLEFAEKGRTGIAVKSDEMILNKSGIGKYVAEELSSYGYDCRCDVGVSDFKIDVAVVDPKNKHNFILAILCDGKSDFSVKDRTVMQVQTLKRSNWNVTRLYSINFFNNPKREIKRIKELLDRICSGGKTAAPGFKRIYRAAKVEECTVDTQYVLSGEHDADIMKIIRAIVAAEEPISTRFLTKRTLATLGIFKFGVKLEGKISSLIDKCALRHEEILGATYYFRTDKFGSFDRYRVEENTALRTSDADYAAYDVISAIKSVLLSKVSMYADELAVAVQREFKVPRLSDKFAAFINSCIDYGVSKGIFVRSISDKISMV